MCFLSLHSFMFNPGWPFCMQFTIQLISYHSTLFKSIQLTNCFLEFYIVLSIFSLMQYFCSLSNLTIDLIYTYSRSFVSPKFIALLWLVSALLHTTFSTMFVYTEFVLCTRTHYFWLSLLWFFLPEETLHTKVGWDGRASRWNVYIWKIYCLSQLLNDVNICHIYRLNQWYVKTYMIVIHLTLYCQSITFFTENPISGFIPPCTILLFHTSVSHYDFISCYHSCYHQHAYVAVTTLSLLLHSTNRFIGRSKLSSKVIQVFKVFFPHWHDQFNNPASDVNSSSFLYKPEISQRSLEACCSEQ